jgi:hypothetical protein
VELRLEVERAEDREFKTTLDATTLTEKRPETLSALWALVRHWDTKGRPQASRSHTAFPTWAAIVGGIVEAAGYSCPLESPSLTIAADLDGDEMRSLVLLMAARNESLTFGEVVRLAQENVLFESMVGGAEDGDLNRKQRTSFGRLLSRYERRLIGDYRFLVTGSGKTRRYGVESIRNDRNDIAGEETTPDTHSA